MENRPTWALEVQTSPSFRSKIGMVWVVLALVCMFALVVGRMLMSQDPAIAYLVVGYAVTLASVFAFGGLPCRYALEDNRLRVQSGCFVRFVRYDEIVDAAPVRDWVWAPALSDDRVLLRCRDREVRVSPVRQQEFLVELGLRLRRIGEPSAHSA